MFDAPHGAVCAALLPHVMTANLQALRERQPDASALRRYDDLGPLLTGLPAARAEQAVAWVRRLVADLRIPALATYGLREEDVPVLVAKAAQASSMKANPIPLTPVELTGILGQARAAAL